MSNHNQPHTRPDPFETCVITETRNWVKEVVLRHNFCPFAHRPFQQEAIRYAVTLTDDPDQVADVLMTELLLLHDSTTDADANNIETTLLITPNCLLDFRDYNDFLNIVDMVIAQLDLCGVIQVASFHPDYQFADLGAWDVRNYTNRSLYPMFHLILEDSIEDARATYPNVETIPQLNMTRLEKLGLDEAQQQLRRCREES